MIFKKTWPQCFAIIVLNLSIFVWFFFFISLYAIYIHWKCVKLKKTKAEKLLIKYKIWRGTPRESTKFTTKHRLLTSGWNAALTWLEGCRFDSKVILSFSVIIIFCRNCVCCWRLWPLRNALYCWLTSESPEHETGKDNGWVRYCIFHGEIPLAEINVYWSALKLF